MDVQVKEYMDKYPEKIVAMYARLRDLIFESVTYEPEEKLWAKLPSFYVGDNFIRLIPFKDHMNIEAQAITKHANELAGYKITPKGMLQLYLKQKVPAEVLKKIFAETLER